MWLLIAFIYFFGIAFLTAYLIKALDQENQEKVS
jgi:hypothetical protein